MPSVAFMIAIDCARSAPPRNSAFHAACRNAASSTSAMAEGVSKTNLVVPAKAGTHNPRWTFCATTLPQQSRPYYQSRWLWVPAFAGTTPEVFAGYRFLPLERGLEAVELRDQRIADRGALG